MIWAFLGCILAAVLILIVAKFCYRLAFYNANLQEQDPYILPPGEQYLRIGDRLLQTIHEVNTHPYEQVYITSHDGLKLAARYHHVQDGAPLQIQFHGFHSSAVRDMCGGNILARKMGFNVLMVDQRAHGKSGGHTISFGIEERYDCLDWVNYAINRFGADTKIVLVGLSMGGATVLMASDLNLPDNVVGIVADCPYSSPGEIIRKVSRNMKIPAWPGYMFAVLGAAVYGHFCLFRSSAVKAVQNSKVPILIFHGEDDNFVPCDMSRKIYEACKDPKMLVTIPGAGHGLCYILDPVKYENSLIAFFQLCRENCD